MSESCCFAHGSSLRGRVHDPLLLVFLAELLAGAMNARAGGGSFVSLPALIAAGVPPVRANASSTVALFPGGVASAWAYRDGLGPVGPLTPRWLMITTLSGGFVGAILLLRTSSTAFIFVLPWLPLIACLALAFGRRLGEALRGRGHLNGGVALIVQFGLGIYGGYFGGAVGIMMMAVWSLIDSRDFKSLNAPRMLLVSTANVCAVLTFVIAHVVHWHETVVILVAAIVGGYGGALIGRRIPPRVTRAGTLLVTFFITATFFVRGYAPTVRHRSRRAGETQSASVHALGNFVVLDHRLQIGGALRFNELQFERGDLLG
jgi:uncharacterized protein